MKRFTDTEKWRDPWFQKLSNKHRMLWFWILDRVDNAGVVDICWPICSAETQESMSEIDMDYLKEKVEKLGNGKWFVVNFTSFQFGELSPSPAHKVHASVIKLLSKHSLLDRVGTRLDNGASHTPKEKDKDKYKEKVYEKDLTQALKANPAYSHIDIEREMAKMDAWILANPGRKKSKKFVVNWLNRVPVPIQAKKRLSFEEIEARKNQEAQNQEAQNGR